MEDVVIDLCADSRTTLRACMELNRNSYGFGISKDFHKKYIRCLHISLLNRWTQKILYFSQVNEDFVNNELR